MGFCVCKDCPNDSGLLRCRDISFFSYPKGPKIRTAWEVAIKWTEYPKSGKVCFDHFTPDSFIQSSTCQHKSASSTPLFRSCRYLQYNAVPSIFSHKEESAERSNTVNRIKKREHQEVTRALLH